MASWRKIPGEDEELAFGLLQGSEEILPTIGRWA